MPSEEGSTGGSVAAGCLLGCLSQIGFFVLAIAMLSGFGPHSGFDNELKVFGWTGWGLMQWIGLSP